MKFWAVAFSLLCACGKSSDATDAGAPASVDGSLHSDAAVADCPRSPAAANRTRRVVISHPYVEGGGPGQSFALFELSAAGDLTPTETTFELGRATQGTIEFTPDGEIGILAQHDGTVGVFKIDEVGSVQVIEAAYTGKFYAASIAMDPTGTRAYVLDREWRESGGGIYALRIACDGSITEEGQVLPAKLPAALIHLSGDRAVLAADDAMASPLGQDVHLLNWSLEPAWMSAAHAFSDDSAIVSSAALTRDERYVLIGENNSFSGLDNRVAVIEVGESELTPVQVITPLLDPIALVASPFDNTAMAVSGFGDGIFRLEYDASNASSPFSNAGELDYVGAPPQLPGSAVLVTRGDLTGRVFVSENLGIRQLQFEQDGSITDLGMTTTGSGIPAIVGAIGVQP